MPDPSRRQFVVAALAGTALAAAGGVLLRPAPGQGVVVVGGGPAGARAALDLARATPAARITLIERDPHRLAGGAARVTHPLLAAFAQPLPGVDLAELGAAGVAVVLDEVAQIDGKAARLALYSGRALAFDALVLAPGTAARPEPIAGLDARARHAWPAAWGTPAEARRLAAQIAALPGRGHLVLRLPEGEISHPQVALARALALAGHLARHRPEARLSVLDGTENGCLAQDFATQAARRGLSGVAWLRPGQGGRVLAIDAARGRLETDAGSLRADVVNFVPPHWAGQLAQQAGLTDASGWCPCDAAGRPTLHLAGFDGALRVLGDARKGATRTLAQAQAQARGGGAPLI